VLGRLMLSSTVGRMILRFAQNDKGECVREVLAESIVCRVGQKLVGVTFDGSN
jgi:Tfp pilus assembly pilus retraction ATPase PilT